MLRPQQIKLVRIWIALVHHKKYPLTAFFGCFGYFFFAFHFTIFLKKVQKSGGQSEGTSFLKPGRFPGSHWQKQPWNRNSDGCRCWMWWKYRCVPATPESPSGSHHWHTKDSRSYALAQWLRLQWKVRRGLQWLREFRKKVTRLRHPPFADNEMIRGCL